MEVVIVKGVDVTASATIEAMKKTARVIVIETTDTPEILVQKVSEIGHVISLELAQEVLGKKQVNPFEKEPIKYELTMPPRLAKVKCFDGGGKSPIDAIAKKRRW